MLHAISGVEKASRFTFSAVHARHRGRDDAAGRPIHRCPKGPDGDERVCLHLSRHLDLANDMRQCVSLAMSLCQSMGCNNVDRHPADCAAAHPSLSPASEALVLICNADRDAVVRHGRPAAQDRSYHSKPDRSAVRQTRPARSDTIWLVVAVWFHPVLVTSTIASRDTSKQPDGSRCRGALRHSTLLCTW